MHVQVVTFALEGVTEEEYVESCKAEAAIFAGLPGLLTKIWLRDSESNTYGAVYLWRDRAAYEAYRQGEVWASVEGDPSLSKVTCQGFDVIEDLTRATQPGAALL